MIGLAGSPLIGAGCQIVRPSASFRFLRHASRDREAGGLRPVGPRVPTPGRGSPGGTRRLRTTRFPAGMPKRGHRWSSCCPDRTQICYKDWGSAQPVVFRQQGDHRAAVGGVHSVCRPLSGGFAAGQPREPALAASKILADGNSALTHLALRGRGGYRELSGVLGTCAGAVCPTRSWKAR